MDNKTDRIEYLDGLRGIAAAIVVLHHLIIGFYPSTYTRALATIHTSFGWEYLTHDTPLGILFNGGLAVTIFLLLSGYMVGLSTKKLTLASKVADGVVKRFFRFFLPIVTTNIIAFGLVSMAWFWNQDASQLTGSTWWLGQMWQMKPSLIEAFNQGWGSLFSMYTLTGVYNSSVWTMPFFFLGPVFLSIFLVLSSEWKRRNLILLLSIGGLFWSHFWLIVLGYLLTEIPEDKFRWLNKFPINLIWIIGLLILGNYPQAYDTAAASWLYGKFPILSFTHTSTFYQGLAAAGLLMLLKTNMSAQKWLSAKLFKFLGKVSFSLYLGHILVINTITSWVFIEGLKFLPYSQAFLISVLVSIPVMIGGSIGLYKFMEIPSVKLSQVVLSFLSKTNATMSPYARNSR